MFYLHRRTSYGRYQLMGEYETDYVEFAFRDCVNSYVGDNVWVSTDADIAYNHMLINYDPDHHNFLDVDDWDYSILQTIKG